MIFRARALFFLKKAPSFFDNKRHFLYDVYIRCVRAELTKAEMRRKEKEHHEHFYEIGYNLIFILDVS